VRDDGHAVALTLALADGRAVDARVPIDRLLGGAARLERPDAIVALARVPGHAGFVGTDGRAVALAPPQRALAEGRAWGRLGRPGAASLGRPARTAVAGLARVNAGPFGRWGVVVVASAARERDRAARARWRLAIGVVVVGGVVFAFGGAALRTQRKEHELA